MSNNLVIVAIPDENDRVWKVSSEKIPHLTLLFLGDVDKVANADQITQFVEHAANTTLKRFYLPVDRRGELGDDKADVLFFKKGRYDYKAIRDFRVQLLKNDNIRTAYDSATQFDGVWQPHLTLGYPDTPAKADDTDRDFGFYDVGFNKIAVWFGDFEGPDFLLKDYWDEYDALETVPMDVPLMMSDIRGMNGEEALRRYGVTFEDFEPDNLAQTSIEEGAEFLVHSGVMTPDYFLEHFGKKGMKWGVRSEDTAKGGHIRISNKTNRATVSGRNLGAITGLALFTPALGLIFLSPRYRAEATAAGKQNRKVQGDKKFKKAIENSKQAVKVHNTASKEINAKLPAFNGDKRWEGMTAGSPKQKEYDTAISKELMNPAYAKAAVKVYGSESPSGRYKFEINDAGTATLKFRDTLKEAHDAQVEHAAGDDEEISISFIVKRDSTGHILGFQLDDAATEVAQSAMEESKDLAIDFLEHFGVKGMHWGVTREHLSSAGNAAKSTAGKVSKAATAVSKFAGDVSFENRVKQGDQAEVQQSIAIKAKTAFKRTDLPAIKDKPEYQEAKKLTNRLRHPKDSATKAYRKEVKTAYIKRLEDAANSMTNASGTRQYTIRERGWELPAEGGALPKSKHYWDVSSREIKHAAGDDEIVTVVEVTLDDDGFVIDINPIKSGDSLAQTMDLGADFLEHFGVKGMRWGQRKTPPEATASLATSRVPHGNRRRTKIDTSGGENHPAHDDAIAVAESRIKLKKSGTAALSNAELQKMAKRLQLEVQVAQLTSSRGQKFITRQLEQTGQQTVQKNFSIKTAKKVGKRVGKAAATGAVTVALL